VYIDADAMVVRSIEKMFEFPGYPPAFSPGMFPPDQFNAGILALRPSLKLYEHMMSYTLKLRSHDCGDQGFLNRYLRDWFLGDGSNRMPVRGTYVFISDHKKWDSFCWFLTFTDNQGAKKIESLIFFSLD
jgi:hypothetical protein